MLKLNNFALFENVSINLRHVTTVKIRPEDERIVFNLDYSTKREGNTIADFIYVDGYVLEDLRFINSEYFKRNFIEYDTNEFVNIDSIASAKYNHEKQCAILNLNHLHTYNMTFKKGNSTFSKKVNMPKYVYAKMSFDDYNNMFV